MLILAIEQRRTAVVKLLLDRGADIERSVPTVEYFDGKQTVQLTPLRAAALIGDLETVTQLLERGARPASQRWVSPLADAIETGHDEVVRSVLVAGASTEEIVYGVPAIYRAVLQRSPACLRVLIERGANLKAPWVSEPDPKRRWERARVTTLARDPLECALSTLRGYRQTLGTYEDGFECARLLLEAGLPLDRKGREYRTAASNSEPRLLSLLGRPRKSAKIAGARARLAKPLADVRDELVEIAGGQAKGGGELLTVKVGEGVGIDIDALQRSFIERGVLVVALEEDYATSRVTRLLALATTDPIDAVRWVVQKPPPNAMPNLIAMLSSLGRLQLSLVAPNEVTGRILEPRDGPDEIASKLTAHCGHAVLSGHPGLVEHLRRDGGFRLFWG